MRSNILKVFAALLLAFAVPMWSLAQRTTATFAGIVTDPSGAVLPGVEVHLTNEGTSAAMQQISNETGEFIFNFVPVGNYTLKLVLPGFKTYESKNIPLGAAQNVRKTYSLEVGSVDQSVTVSGEAPLVNTLSPEQRLSLDLIEVKSLPVFNRNITNILDVAIGVSRDQDGSGGGRGAQRLRLNGLGGSAMTITADGTNASMNGGSAASVSGYGGYNKIDVMSSEALGEVQIVKGVFAAEYGSAMGGNLSYITKSGTNELHGSVFYRYEGSALSARNAFLTSEPNSVWNQFGGSIGGPIRKDKTFFFFAYEGYRQRTADAITAQVPTPLLRNAMLTGLNVPETQLVLNYYPLPNTAYGPTDNLATWTGPAPKANDDDHIDFKVDHSLFGGTLSFSGSAGHPFASRPSGLPTNPDVFHAQNERGSLNYVYGKATWTAATRVGYNRNYEPRDATFNVATQVPGNRVERTPGGLRVPAIGFSGMTGLGGRVQHRGLSPGYSFEQQLSLFRGKHSWKFGGLLNLRSGGKTTIDPEGVSFQTLTDVQNNTPSGVSYMPGIYPYRFRAHDFGLFIQDDWRLSQKLVLNLGLRYERYEKIFVKPFHADLPACVCNQGALIDAVAMTWEPPRDPKNPFPNDNLSLAPRFGFAYTLDQKGDFVVRGGFGVGFQGYDEQTFTTNIAVSPFIPSSRNFTRNEAASFGLKYPVYRDDLTALILAQTGTTPIIGTRFSTSFHPPYAMNYTLGIQRAITAATAVDIAFVGTRGVKFTLNRPYNTPDRITGIRPNPNDINGTYIDPSQQTNYNSLQASLKQRMTSGLLFNANYTWGKALGYTGGDVGQGFNGDTYGGIEDFWAVKIERGPNAGDVTHNFSSNWVYELPTPFANSAAAKQILGGWQVAGIWRAQTGQPIQVTQTGGRPDLLNIEGAINEECCGYGKIQYLNPAAFKAVTVMTATSGRTERRGNMNVSALRGPGLWNVDLSLTKSINLSEQRKLELKSDIGNVFNHTEYYSAIQTNFSSPGFGRFTATRPARTVQVQARIAF
jgi:hypothetical protein